MSKQASSATLRLCQPRKPIPGGSQQDRLRDYAETLHREGPFLIKSELDRIRPVDPAPDSFLSRLFKAIDVLLGRTHVYVDRRQPRQ